ncbi:MAG: site-2 protease family protein [Drouetiella hepatica Uher 2000/2452]|jgi:membrane-associated protease RseP (regulator of RpoE activity)|uniref:Site-2 protease family protein n=1 Tax=Drouetiella hepatica Uher 2000/2452 TaxID=904376 RepID=A0A951QGK6_9CYAN|nr:site-2 protease family protein [Drouetiella hepatica Uher 2000/2452]
MILLLLILIGIFTYFIVQRSVAGITRTPVWLLWLVMMIPAFAWMSWLMVNGSQGNDFHLLLLLSVSFVVSSTLYWVLVQRGRLPAAEVKPTVKPPLDAQPALAALPEPRSPLRPMSREEEASLQTCFPWSIYFLQNIEPRPQALICRGQLRTSPEIAYNTVQKNIEANFSDRFLVVFQEGINGKPFFALVPNPQSKAIPEESGTPIARSSKPERIARPFLAIGLLLATLLTTTLAGVILSRPVQVPPALQMPQTQAEWMTGLPYALALMTILVTHELAHYLMARRHHMRVTLPYLIPVPPANIFPFGTFGAFIQMRSPIPNRKALFDIGIAGPLAGFVVTVPILLWGLAHSTPIPLSEESGLLNFNSFEPTASLLIALFSKLALGNALTAEQALKLHPVAIAGCLGIVLTALNLLPVGSLDGGHIVHAMFGQRVGASIGRISQLLVFVLLILVQQELLIWAVVLFLMPVVDEAALNDVSDLDNRRDFLGLMALFLLVSIILPAPQAIMQIVF